MYSYFPKRNTVDMNPLQKSLMLPCLLIDGQYTLIIIIQFFLIDCISLKDKYWHRTTNDETCSLQEIEKILILKAALIFYALRTWVEQFLQQSIYK